MAKFVPDIKTQRWIVIAPQRQDRPTGFAKDQPVSSCPFCPGNENQTPPEISRLGEGDKWSVRVIPNKFPITDIHEVFIHSPDHDRDVEDFTVDQTSLILTAYRQRYLEHVGDGQVMIFCNHGERAGASLTHPHSQLVVIPRQINLDALVREPVMNVIEDFGLFVSYCPDFSQWPYEAWISPKREGTVFGEITDSDIEKLAAILIKTLKRLKKKYIEGEINGTTEPKIFSYNYYVHHGKNWFIRIIPRLVHRAGFELGTGLSVNVVDPTRAASELSSIRI